MSHPRRIGRYEVVAPLASGGMAVLYLARTTGLGGFVRHVVLKVLGDNTAPGVRMFLDEARLVGMLHHSNIHQVFEVGRSHDCYFLAMEYVHGVNLYSLRNRAAERGLELPLDIVLTIIRGVACALRYAHELRDGEGQPLGIVHRDISPSNILASYEGDVKLIDFGIARSATQTTTTRVGILKGTSGYMAPEYLRGRAPDRRSDLFALGVILYELTCHRRAFEGADGPHRIIRGELAPPSVVRYGYPRDLERLVLATLESDPEDRIPSAAAVIAAIDGIATRHGLRLGPECVASQLRSLYGSPPLPWSSTAADDAITCPCPTVKRPTEAPPTRPTRPRLPSPARSTLELDEMEVEIEIDVEPSVVVEAAPPARPGTLRGVGREPEPPRRPSASPPPLPALPAKSSASPPPARTSPTRSRRSWRVALGIVTALLLGTVAGVTTHRLVRRDPATSSASRSPPAPRPHLTLD